MIFFADFILKFPTDCYFTTNFAKELPLSEDILLFFLADNNIQILTFEQTSLVSF